MKLAALLTCHNRRELTLACLRSLMRVAPRIDIYLTDDGSTDGTAEAVVREFPQVRILQGDGTLYWNRGMYRAWQAALAGEYDYYLWLNDDLELQPGFLDELLQCALMQEDPSIVCGIVADQASGEVIYGGYDAQRRLVQPAACPQRIRLMNGNAVLVPHAVVRQIGILDPYFLHDLGDLDYGLRAQEQGIPVLSTRCVVALGHRNDVCRIRRWGTTIRGRFQRLNAPLGSPLRQNFYYRRRHFGWLHAVAFCTYVLVLNLLPDAWVRKI